MQSLPPNLRAALWMVASCFAFAALWIMIRLASAELHPFAIAVWRNLVGLLFLLPMWLANPGLIRFSRYRNHLQRATSGVIATFATFYAVSSAPLANVLAINYTAPFFATLGAMLFLGEKVRWVRGAALVAGFVGMLMVLRPGALPMSAGLYAAIVSALATAFSYLAIKALTGIDDPRAVTLWTFILITPVSMLLALPWWSWPSAGLLPVLAALGACAAIGQLGLARALSLADASAVIPFDFVRFCLITLAGVLIFGERYDMMTLAGGGVILVAGVVLALREQALARQRARAAAADSGDNTADT